ncbi:F-box/WD-40 repeat-containing protein At5g21040-like [Malania oleifera]|uniref:F-box/WD-40 repeat-containing protein At5g21040-like n=1 Tax=Malania oleifera TaxID=397392 RepID=UPI0025AE0251|nr:F-box/WD-40 repeat-containing protein At5g21040-like [Malania oleifera]
MAFESQGSYEILEKLVDIVANYPEEQVDFAQSKPCFDNDQVSIDDFKLDKGKGKLVDSKDALEMNPKLGTTKISKTKLALTNDVSSTRHRSITDLPRALILEILNYLDPKALGAFCCVSTILRRITSEHHIWKVCYCARWGFLEVSTFGGSELTDGKTWKELFSERELKINAFKGEYNLEVLYGHTEIVRTVFLLPSANLIFSSGDDCTVCMWNMEDGSMVASSRPLGCVIHAVAADTKLLVAGTTHGFIHCWKAIKGFPFLFDLKGSQNQPIEFRLWEHEGPITCVALDHTRIYSGSLDMTIRLWDRSMMKCISVLRHDDAVWMLIPRGSMVVSTSGDDVYLWDTTDGGRRTPVRVIYNLQTKALAVNHGGNFIFAGGEEEAIHVFEVRDHYKTIPITTWYPHAGPVLSLAFEFPWLVAASTEGRLSLVDVRLLLRSKRSSMKRFLGVNEIGAGRGAPREKTLYRMGGKVYSVDIKAAHIVCGGEDGLVRVCNFSQGLGATAKK